MSVAAFAAGLLLGFGGLFVYGTGVGIVLVVVLGAARRPVPVSLAFLLVAGALTAVAAQRHDESCSRLIRRTTEWHALLYDSAEPGAFVAAELRAHSCRARAHVVVRTGSAAGGTLVSIAGKLSGGSGGLLVREAAISEPRRGSLLLRWRMRVGRAIDDNFGDRAGMARALLIADSRSLNAEIRDQFATAGVAHLLSISGLHVGIIAVAAQLLLTLAGLRRNAALTGAAAVTALYVLLLGAPPSAVRAGAMLAAVAATRVLQRPTSAWALLAVGALIPLIDPRTVQSIGYQLSVSGMAGVIAAGALAKRCGVMNLKGVARPLALATVTTIVATAVTAPIIAWHFGRISLVGPLANLVATPLLVFVQPVLFLALVLEPVPSAVGFLADASAIPLDMLQWVAATSAAPHWASLDVAPSLAGALLSGAASLCVVVACVAVRYVRPLTLAVACVALLVWRPLVPSGGHGLLEVHMIDVGQGDAVAVRVPDGSWLLLDAGRSWQGGDAGRRTVIPYLRRRGGRLFGFILSHPHSDHVGGAASVIRWMHPQHYWDAAYVSTNADYRASLLQAQAADVRWQRVHPGEMLNVGGALLEFLAPDSTWTAHLADPNEASTVVAVQFGDVRVLFTGDAEAAEEGWLLRASRNRLNADILKVAHHGSRTSTTPEFLAAVSPAIALVSVGEGNGYGHPSPEVMARLTGAGATVLRTDELGSVVLKTDGTRIWLEAHGEKVVLR